MMPGSLKQILQHKKEGDEWHSFLAPEEYHVWTKPWNKKKWDEYDVSVYQIAVSGSETVENTKNETNLSIKNRLYLDKTGIDIYKGKYGTKMKRYGSFNFRVDGISELNGAINDLVSITKIEFWQLTSLTISNKDTGGICEFRRHNPDGNGTGFYLWRLQTNEYDRLYPDVSLAEQSHYLGKFKQYFAACKCSVGIQKFHGCVIDKSKKKPI
jgi:hypothetical protein